MATVTDFKWMEDLAAGYGFTPGLAFECRVDGKWLRRGVKYKPGQKEQAKQALIAWATELGVDLNDPQAAQ